MTTTIRSSRARLRLPVLLILTLAASSPAVAQDSEAARYGASPDSASRAARIEPGDVVRLRIWREPDLSGEFPVDDRGMAVFPKIGPIHVADFTADSLRRSLIQTYAQYLRDPAIEVTCLRRITILGAVNRPGLYPIDPTIKVREAFALAGGTLATGSPKHFQLRRGGAPVDVDFSSDTPVGRTPIRSGDELFVPERSWLGRNSGYVTGALITASAIIVAGVLRN